VKFAVGDAVVYGTHGIGRVISREKQGAAGELVVLELGEGLTVTLPLERAREQLRPVASKADLSRVQDTLREERSLSFDPWLSRRREMLEKLAAGTLAGLAEIVSEGAQRERIRVANGSAPRLPTAERDVIVKARELLSGEIALALSLQPTDADDWIEQQLSRSESS
jgi:CarD family transcriptional regulator, regulator of rRNA transcription